MKYFIDTEFIEKPNTIQLISIGIVAEDGSEYHAVSSEYNFDDASDWVKENVIRPYYNKHYLTTSTGMGATKGFRRLPLNKFHKDKYGFTKPISQIKEEILKFISQTSYEEIEKMPNFSGNVSFFKDDDFRTAVFKSNPPEFWGYYADYDWVVFCWIFGTMMELPEGWPMYCKDLKQLADEWGIKYDHLKQENEHNALDDAKWNKMLYEYLSTYIAYK